MMIARTRSLRGMFTWMACAFMLMVVFSPGLVRGEAKAEKTFSALVTDSQGVETDLKHVLFYWEEKVSDTAFVPHELKHIPVKRGNATVNVKFDSIKTVDVKPVGDQPLPLLTIVLTNGQSGEFTLALPGRFRGQSDFGETELPVAAIRKIVFR